MTSRSCVVLFVLAVVALPAGAAELKLPCPAPDTIKKTVIPHSVNVVYSAESKGIGFGGLSAGDFVNPPFVAAEVSEVNGYWSLTCAYEQGGAGLPLVTNTSPAFQTCKFADGSTECKGTIATCTFICQETPPAKK